jgi:hypothetical protein
MSKPREDQDLKVTDNRMFDEHGELREQFRHLEDEDASEDEQAPPQEAAASRAQPAPAVPAPEPRQDRNSNQAPTATAPPPGYETAKGPNAMQFMDLVAVLAEPIALFLGDAALPDGRTAEDPERARLYIDLLAILRDKTSGNLEPQEAAVLDDLIYRLRLRYVEKKT